MPSWKIGWRKGRENSYMKNNVKKTRNNKKTDIDVLIPFTDNEYVADLDFKHNKLKYTKEFYFQMNKLLEEGKSAAEAYDALGFDTKILGRDRANAAATRARELAKGRKARSVTPKDFDGSKPIEEMGDLTPEEFKAYAQAREIYLLTLLDYQKKIDAFLEENPYLLNTEETSEM